MTPQEFLTFLERTSKAFVDQDFAVWASHVALPASRVTAEGCFTCTTESELRREFEGYCTLFAEAGVTELRRSNPVIEDIEGDQLLVTYDTEILSGEDLVYEPYTSSMILRRGPEGQWLISSVMNAVGMKPTPLPEGQPGRAAQTAEAMAIYQDVLDHVSRAVNSDTPEDAEPWLAKPHVLQTDDVEITLRTVEMVRATLRDFSDNLKRMGMTDYIRIAKEAWFVDPDHIAGWHLTYALNSGINMVEPYKVDMRLAHLNGVWRVTHNRSHVLNHECRIISPALLTGPRPADDTH